MIIHKVKSEEQKDDQHWEIVFDCIDHWYIINNAKYPNYPDLMNMKTCRYNYEHHCFVAITYHFNPNKW